MKQAEMMEHDMLTGVETVLGEDGSEVSFRLWGEIDHHSAKSLREKMDTVIAKHHPRRVKLDLGRVGFMDSAGLGLMLGRYTRVSEYGGELILVDPTPSIRKILTLAGADKLFPTVITDRQTFRLATDQEGIQ